MTEQDRPMATILTDAGRLGLRFERRLAHPPHKVWRALTESSHLQHWLPCDIIGERHTGAPITLPFWPDKVEKAQELGIDSALKGQIRVWDPPRVFEWTWETDVLRWELTDQGDHTQLTFTTWIGEQPPVGIADTAAGYHVCLDQLASLLDTGSAAPADDARVAHWEAQYSAAAATQAAVKRT